MDRRHPSAPPRQGTNMSMTGAGGPVPGGGGAGSGRGPSQQQQQQSTINNSVRRNLFQSQLTRRPTGSSAASSASSSSTSAETLRLDGQGHIQGQTTHSRSRSGTTHTTTTTTNTTTGQTGPEFPGGVGGGGGDIVIRDTNGEIYLQDPPTPPLDDMDEMNLDTEQENERERKRLAEAVRQHQIDQNSIPVQPEELLEAVRASLRAKVAALAEDNWMYEREDPPRLQ
ncbi:hypothetical protein QBC37DRAFT_425636 [Rhypophila decipiens]|uniref:Uncharacterized protein n=1 Tax=Rhypophila decipiens TaxID=261697 RepID=A0AAN7B6Q8_9PEZI|nr:hypothetical protein QBC37DRAFT_425636 [Rhypophila decipiens]